MTKRIQYPKIKVIISIVLCFLVAFVSLKIYHIFGLNEFVQNISIKMEEDQNFEFIIRIILTIIALLVCSIFSVLCYRMEIGRASCRERV